MLIRVLTFLFALAVAGAGFAAEEIQSFDVLVLVQPDGSLQVTETISVTAEGNQIRRGIYRDIPVQYREEHGQVSLATLSVMDVRRNGAPEPYSVSPVGADKRIRIGDADVFLDVPSQQTYEITYRTQGQLRSLDTVDELFWNVTGDRWDFPILQASVEIRLPDGTPILQHAAYTGRRGATGTAFEVDAVADGEFRAHTTRRLNPGEGFSVAIGWRPGAVEVPPVRYGVQGINGYTDPPMTLGGMRLGPYAALLGTLLGVLTLFFLWVRVGRDPPGGAIYPQFEPPGNLSPAAIRYVTRQGFDRRCLTAAILSMAVKGAVKIVEGEAGSFFRRREYSLQPQGASGHGLSVGETAAYQALFPSGSTLTLKSDKTNGGRVDRARKQLKSKLWDEHYGASFRRNTLYSLGGIAVGAVTSLFLVAIVERWNMLSLIQWAVPALLAGLTTYAAGFFWMEMRDAGTGGRPILRRLLTFVPLLIFMLFAFTELAGLVGALVFLALGTPGIYLSGVAFGVVAAVFHFLMAAPTKAGKTLLDQIEGFELYMRTAEEDRLQILNPPEKTPELFERLLPYAVALGIAHQWSAKFAGVLAASTVPPDWYSGSHRFDADALDREFSHAVASTSTPASRSSGGSGGGGSSGGGGGGGGGGGW